KRTCARWGPNTIFMRKKWPSTGNDSETDSVQSFIRSTIYDLDTVRYLKEYSRLRETLPILNRVLTAVDSFPKRGLPRGSARFFDVSFWEKEFRPGVSLSSMRQTVENL